MAEPLFDAALLNAVKGLKESERTGLNPMQQQVLTGQPQATLEERRKHAADSAQRMRDNRDANRLSMKEESLRAEMLAMQSSDRAFAFRHRERLQAVDDPYGLKDKTPVTGTPTPTPVTTTPNPMLGKNPDMNDLPEFDTPTPSPGLDIDQAFDDAGAGISEIYQKLATKDYSTMIKDLVAQGRLAAGNLNAAQLKEITDATTRRDDQLKTIQTDTKTDITTLNTQRIAQMTALENALSARMTAFKDRTDAFIAQGQDRIAELGPEISGEFTEMATMVSTMVDSMSESSIGSFERLSAVANMAAAQRLAAPALMYMDAKTALGDEKMRMEHEANMLKATTLESLNVQERELLLNEAMRIEQFNNNRDMSEAQALVNLGMTKLQATITEVHRAEDKAERARTQQISVLLQKQAETEDKRRWDAEFGLKKSAAASATASAAAQNKFLTENSGWDISDVSAMSDSMRSKLFDQISEANAAMQTDMAEMQNEYFDLTNNGWSAGEASTAINFWNLRMADQYLADEGVSSGDEQRKALKKSWEAIQAPYMRQDGLQKEYLGGDWEKIQQAFERLQLIHDPPDPETGEQLGLGPKYSGSPGLMSPGSIVPGLDPNSIQQYLG